MLGRPAPRPRKVGLTHGTTTGHVSPGGPPDVRELSGLTITKVSVGEMDNNAYLLRCQHTDEQLLVDAAAEAPRLLALVGPSGLASVVTTHRHWDHVGALGAVRDATGARTYAGADDVEGIPVPTDVPLHRRRRRRGRPHRLEVIHLVGHTPGSVALLYDDPAGTPHLWTGDSLFPGGVGNTFGDARSLRVAAPRRRAPSSSTGCPTRPGSTPATARTPRSAPSARTSTTWASRGW